MVKSGVVSGCVCVNQTVNRMGAWCGCKCGVVCSLCVIECVCFLASVCIEFVVSVSARERVKSQ